MIKVYKILIICFLFFSVGTQSQQYKIINYTIKNGLQYNTINQITQDSIGYLWLATKKGIVRFDGDEFKHIDAHSKSKVFSLNYKNNTLFIGSESGFFTLKNNKIKFIGKEKVLKTVFINNQIFLATNQGIYQFKEGLLQPLQIHTKIDFSIITDIFLHHNKYYIVTNNGLWKTNNLLKPSKVVKILNEGIITILNTNNHIIIGNRKNEIKIIQNDTIINQFEIDGNISSLNKNNNELWVSTNNNGIAIYSIIDLTFKQKIHKYNSDISNNINSIFIDNKNTVWIASEDKGFYKLENQKSTEQYNKPTVFLENVRVNHKKLDSLNNNLITLKSTENNISFNYKTVSLNTPKKVLYRYKLSGTFSPWSSNNNVEFASLKAGKYTFSYQSKIEDLKSDIKHLKFIIDAPIYKKGWFLIITFIAFILILLGIIESNIRKLKKKNLQKVDRLKLENRLLNLKQKALQLQMNPHFIFNVLNGIKALGNSGNTKELNKTISQFSVLLRSVLNNSRLEEISLHDEIETLKNYLELEQKMNSKTFEFTIEKNLKNIDSEEILIPSMLLQPFVENAIKHGIIPNSKNNIIKVNFEVKNYYLECSIIDNGIGFHQSIKVIKKHKSVALQVTKERIENISKNSKFLIEELKENNSVVGTKVWFKIPLKTDY